ncbi:ATP-binding protein, partial [Pediococcus acidilactici]
TGIKQKTDKDFKFKLDLAASKLQIDQALFKELMINLLDNAIQALPENEGCLKVSGSLLQDTYQLQLVDNGKGIDTEMMNRVFDPFVSGQKYEGNHLGLGLAITRQIVTSLN